MDWLRSIWEGITSIPSLILNGIKEIFIPDIDEINNSFNGLFNTVKGTLNVDYTDFQNLFTTSTIDDEGANGPYTDVNTSYDMGLLSFDNLPIVDYQFLARFLEKFQPLIKGFMVLLLIIFNVRQALSFIGQDAGAIAGVVHGENVREAKEAASSARRGGGGD